MKAIRFLIFIPIILLIIETFFILMPLSLIWLMDLSKFWLIIMTIFFGAALMGIYFFLPGSMTYLVTKISPNKHFAFYITMTFSILLGITHIFYFWTTTDLVESGLGTIYRIIFSCLTASFAVSISLGAGAGLIEEKETQIVQLAKIGSLFFYAGVLFMFCLISVKICYINPEKNYTWLSGIWHGIFVLPHWIAGWFLENIYCKASNSTSAYSIWWWISFIFVGLGIFGARGSREN
jgi:hypothetical protein